MIGSRELRGYRTVRSCGLGTEWEGAGGCCWTVQLEQYLSNGATLLQSEGPPQPSLRPQPVLLPLVVGLPSDSYVFIITAEDVQQGAYEESVTYILGESQMNIGNVYVVFYVGPAIIVFPLMKRQAIYSVFIL